MREDMDISGVMKTVGKAGQRALKGAAGAYSEGGTGEDVGRKVGEKVGGYLKKKVGKKKGGMQRPKGGPVMQKGVY